MCYETPLARRDTHCRDWYFQGYWWWWLRTSHLDLTSDGVLAHWVYCVSWVHCVLLRLHLTGLLSKAIPLLLQPPFVEYLIIKYSHTLSLLYFLLYSTSFLPSTALPFLSSSFPLLPHLVVLSSYFWLCTQVFFAPAGSWIMMDDARIWTTITGIQSFWPFYFSFVTLTLKGWWGNWSKGSGLQVGGPVFIPVPYALPSSSTTYSPPE